MRFIFTLSFLFSRFQAIFVLSVCSFFCMCRSLLSLSLHLCDTVRINEENEILEKKYTFFPFLFYIFFFISLSTCLFRPAICIHAILLSMNIFFSCLYLCHLFFYVFKSFIHIYFHFNF